MDQSVREAGQVLGTDEPTQPLRGGGQPEAPGTVDGLAVEIRRELGPDALHIAQEDVGSGRPDPGNGEERLPGVGLLSEPAQIAAVAFEQELGSLSEKGRGPLVVASVAAFSQRVDALLPGGVRHGPSGAHSGGVQCPGRRHRDVGSDAGTEEVREDQRLIQGRRGVAQAYPGLGRIGARLPFQQCAHDRFPGRARRLPSPLAATLRGHRAVLGSSSDRRSGRLSPGPAPACSGLVGRGGRARHRSVSRVRRATRPPRRRVTLSGRGKPDAVGHFDAEAHDAVWSGWPGVRRRSFISAS